MRLVQVRFPHIENIEFVDEAKVWPGEVQKLKDRLPHLRRLDTTRVVESINEGREA